MILTALLLQAATVPPPQAIGIHGGWGAFRAGGPTRCYAIAQPVVRSRSGAFASVSDWPGAGVRGQVHVRLSRARAADARVVLSIGERRFVLTGGPSDAWAADAAADRAIVAAMRSGRSMSVESVAVRGGPFADTYALRGAATAIDAAALTCLRR